MLAWMASVVPVLMLYPVWVTLAAPSGTKLVIDYSLFVQHVVKLGDSPNPHSQEVVPQVKVLSSDLSFTSGFRPDE